MGSHLRVAVDGQCPAVLWFGPVRRVLTAHGPQRLDLDEGFPATAASPTPALTGRCSGPQHVVEDLMILGGRYCLDRRGHLVDAGIERIGHQPHLVAEDAAVEGQEVVGGGVDVLDGLAERHVVEGDRGAVVERPVGALLQGDPVDAPAHTGQRQRQHPGQVARVQAASVHAAAPCLARLQQSVAVGWVDAARMEQKRCRDNVLAAREDLADLVDAGVAWGVENAIGIECEDFVDVGGGGDADGGAVNEGGDVGAVLVRRVHPGADDREVAAVVQDRGQ